MSVWWARRSPDPDEPARDGPPVLVDATANAVRAQVRDRIPGYTPEWTNRRRDDAGVALVRLFGGLVEPVLERVNRLPEKLLIEHLRIAGVAPLPASSARVLVRFEVADSAAAPVLVARGFQLGADPATGEGDRVVFETERDLFAAPLAIAGAARQDRGTFDVVDSAGLDGSGRLLPFGERPRPGAALWLGLQVPFPPGPVLTLAVELAGPEGRPRALSRGGTGPTPGVPPPVLAWQIRRAGRLEPVEVQLDGTAGLRQSGPVELRLPREWAPERPPGLEAVASTLRWLRVQLVHGAYLEPPVVAAVRPNAVLATAARTVRDEVLEPLPDERGRRDGSGAGPRRRLRVAQTPVLPGSLRIEVDEVAAEDVFGVRTDAPARTLAGWREVASLADAGPDERVFVLDPESGVVGFGDGVRGAAVPEGFRNVRAVEYRVGGGPAGAIVAGTRLSPISSAPFVTGAENPARASGGTAPEPVAGTLRRGPLELRTGGRAVTVADYALLARQAPGADVARAYAAAGVHPDVPGTPVPGLVGVLVVPTHRGAGPPLPDPGTLAAVAAHLVERVAPVGVQVVAGAPRYEHVRVEARVVVEAGSDVGVVVRAALDEIDAYLDPVTGGEDGQGWPLGAPLRHAALLGRLLERVAGLRALPSLRLVVDGRRLAPCVDHPTAEHALLWPAGHELVPVEA